MGILAGLCFDPLGDMDLFSLVLMLPLRIDLFSPIRIQIQHIPPL